MGDFEIGYQFMFGIHCCLNVIAYIDVIVVIAHEPGVWIGGGYFGLAPFFKLLLVLFKCFFAVAKLLDPLFYFCGIGLPVAGFGFISLVEFLQVFVYLLVNVF
ncbi:MAG: hypothetical protein AB1847_23275 [bacterium]